MKKRITSLILAVVTVFALIPAMAFSATAEDAAATTPEAYNALYVQDGLTMLLTAFDAASAAAYQASGKWASRVGSAEATLIGSGWKAGENGGLYFNLAGKDTGNEIGDMWVSHKLDMGTANLPAEDFTLEMVINPIGYTVDADGKTQLVASANGSSSYGAETHLSFIIGPLRTNSFPSLGSSSADVNSPLSNRVNSFANNESRWIYGDGVADWGNQGMKQPWGFKNENVLAYTGAAFTWTLTHDLDDAKTDFTYELSRNSAVQWTLARGDDTTGAYIAANDTQPFWLFRSFPTTMYAVRVYNRVLTAEERNWNHFVDILAYAGIDLSGALYTGLSETQKKELAAEFAGRDVGRFTPELFAQAVQQTFGTALEDTRTEADKLYVTDGLTALYTAYGTGKDGVNLATGRWLNKADGTYAIVNGENWKSGEKGISYTLTYGEWGMKGGKHYLDLGAAPATDDWTTEMIVNLKGLTNADGTDCVTEAAAYVMDYSCFEVGAVKGVGFVSTKATPNGEEYQTRFIYRKDGYWLHGRYWAGINFHQWGNKRNAIFNLTMTQTATVEDRSFDLFAGDKTTKVGTYTESNVKGVIFSVSNDNQTWLTVNTLTSGLNANGYRSFTGLDDEGKEVSGVAPRLSASEAYYAPGGNFYLMRGLPGTVYAIRVYNRTLTAAEKQQNHFADLANYFALDLTGLAAIEDKAALFAAFADKDFTADKAALQAELNAFTGAKTALTYDGLAARLSGKSGIRSLWRVDNAAIQALEDAGFTVSYGAIMGLASEYASSSALTVEEGAGKAIVTVYNGGVYTGKVLSSDAAATTFAYTTIFDGDGEATKVNYELKLVYRGFVTVTKGETTSTFYVDMAGETFPATGASCLDVAAYFLANGYADSEVLKAVKAICEAE